MDLTDTIDGRALRRIVAVLLALADLAEHAGSRSPAERCLVLWLLRSGEAMARDYLAGLTRHAAESGDPPRLPVTDDGAAEAMRLAAGFRTLAAALAALAAESLAPSPQAVAALCLCASLESGDIQL